LIKYANINRVSKSIYQFRLSKDEFLFSVGNKICHKTKTGFWYRASGSKNKSLNKAFIDNKDRVWLAYHNNGIEIYKGINDAFYGENLLNKLFRNKNISSIFEDNTGGVWLAIQNSGVYYISNPNIRIHTLDVNELTNRVSTLYKDENNDLFAGTFNGRVYQLDDGVTPERVCKSWEYTQTIYALRFVENSKGEKVPEIHPKITTRDGVIWSFSSSGLSAIKGQDTIYYDPNTRINAVFEDFNGTVWVGSNNGLFQYKQGKLSAMSSISSLFGIRVEDIDQLSDGTLLIGTKSKGIVFWKRDEITIYDESDGLTSNILKDICIDRDEDIWISTPNGLNRLVKSIDGKYSIFNITEVHGLPTREVNKVVAVGNVIWVATNKGVAKFNKHDIKINGKPPTLLINDIFVNEEKVKWEPRYTLPYDRNYLQISFTGLLYRSNGENLYRYRMLGINEEWIVTKERTVRYPSLNDGEYTFQIQAANEDGIWSTTKEIQFIIKPPFWETWWFRTLVVVLAIFSVIVIFRLREIKRSKKEEQKRLLEKQKLLAIKAELKALRAQMNPHFTFNTLSAIQTAVNNSDIVNASKYIGDFASLIRKVLENSKRAQIPLEEELDMLKLYIELEQLRFSSKFSYEIVVDEQLDVDFHQIPSMVIQPYVENAIIHGLAPLKNGNGKLIVDVVITNNAIHCTVEDNGIGREQAMEIKKRKGFAHNSMAMDITEDRMELFRKEMGEEFSVKIIDLEDDEHNSMGTKVELIFPV